jgi:two-component system, cell cycle response regulator
MSSEPLSVLLVGLDEAAEQSLASDGTLVVRRTNAMDGDVPAADVVVLEVDGGGALESLRRVRARVPGAAVVVVTDPADASAGTVAMHAGAEDALVRDEIFAALLPRAIRYAAALRRVRDELATTDDVTGLPNLRGFAPIAEHHLRMSDRASKPVVFVFVRLDDHDELSATGAGAAEGLARDAAAVVLDAVRDSDVPARIAPDTLCVLLSGDAEGAESLVLSRLVEAMAVHDARRDTPRSLSLSVGTTRYEPGSGAGLAHILEDAVRGLSTRA